MRWIKSHDPTSLTELCHAHIQLDDDLLTEPTGAPLAFVFDGTCTPIGPKHKRDANLTPIQTRLMGDSGASARFVSLSFVEQHKLRIKNTHNRWSVRVANNETVMIQGSVDLEINIQGYTDKIKFLVMPMTHDYDIILGNDWFLKRQVELSYGKMVATVHRNGRKYVLRPTTVRESATRTVQHPTANGKGDIDSSDPDSFVLNSAQAKRAIRNRPNDIQPVWIWTRRRERVLVRRTIPGCYGHQGRSGRSTRRGGTKSHPRTTRTSCGKQPPSPTARRSPAGPRIRAMVEMARPTHHRAHP
jgi:hypothetical protein